jgi:hypothetical protein
VILDAQETIEYPFWREYVLFPYRILVSWWLDTLLHRPSNTVFKRAFEKEFAWFMAKHDLWSIENPCLYNLMGTLLNAKLLTLRSQSVEIRLEYLADQFSIGIRPAYSGVDWHLLSTFFDQFDKPREISWSSMIAFLDQNWAQLIEAMSTESKLRGHDG